MVQLVERKGFEPLPSKGATGLQPDALPLMLSLLADGAGIAPASSRLTVERITLNATRQYKGTRGLLLRLSYASRRVCYVTTNAL